MSDNVTSIGTLKLIIKKFCEAREWDRFHGPKDLAIGVVTEASELIETFRFYSDEQCRLMLEDSAKRESISDELVDVMFFVFRFAQMYGIDLTTEFIRKMRKNAARYPVDKCRGNNNKYAKT